MYDEKLVTDNLALIHLMIKKLNCKWETEDEYQNYYDYGLDGLINGAKTYDESKGKASTYLCQCIANGIRRIFYLNSMPKRHNPAGPDLSLNYEVYEGNHINDFSEFGDFIPDPNVNVEEEVEKILERENVLNAVNNLKIEKDKLVVKMYYGLDGYEECKSFDKIAKKFGVSRNAIYSRMERAKKILKKELKNPKDVSIQRENKNRRGGFKMNNDIDSLNNNIEKIQKTILANIEKIDKCDGEIAKEIGRSNAISRLANAYIQTCNLSIRLKHSTNSLKGLLNEKK